MLDNMRAIYKYNFDIKPGVQKFEIPMLGSLLYINRDPRDKDQGAMWFEVELPDWPTKESEVRPFLKKVRLVVVGTGCPIPEGDFSYYGSFIDDAFAWHIYMEV